MARRVTTTDTAARGLRAARRWLTQPGSGLVGARRYAALRLARRSLRSYPYLGVSSPETPGHRQLAISDYRLIHTVEPDTGDADTAGDIVIIAVLGPGQP